MPIFLESSNMNFMVFVFLGIISLSENVRNALALCLRPGLYPDFSDCTKFYMCASYGPVQFECPTGLYFNPTILVCDWPDVAGCVLQDNRTTSRTLSTTNTPSTNVTVTTITTTASSEPFQNFTGTILALVENFTRSSTLNNDSEATLIVTPVSSDVVVNSIGSGSNIAINVTEHPSHVTTDSVNTITRSVPSTSSNNYAGPESIVIVNITESEISSTSDTIVSANGAESAVPKIDSSTRTNPTPVSSAASYSDLVQVNTNTTIVTVSDIVSSSTPTFSTDWIDNRSVTKSPPYTIITDVIDLFFSEAVSNSAVSDLTNTDAANIESNISSLDNTTDNEKLTMQSTSQSTINSNTAEFETEYENRDDYVTEIVLSSYITTDGQNKDNGNSSLNISVSEYHTTTSDSTAVLYGNINNKDNTLNNPSSSTNLDSDITKNTIAAVSINSISLYTVDTDSNVAGISNDRITTVSAVDSTDEERDQNYPKSTPLNEINNEESSAATSTDNGMVITSNDLASTSWVSINVEDYPTDSIDVSVTSNLVSTTNKQNDEYVIDATRYNAGSSKDNSREYSIADNADITISEKRITEPTDIGNKSNKQPNEFSNIENDEESSDITDEMDVTAIDDLAVVSTISTNSTNAEINVSVDDNVISTTTDQKDETGTTYYNLGYGRENFAASITNIIMSATDTTDSSEIGNSLNNQHNYFTIVVNNGSINGDSYHINFTSDSSSNEISFTEETSAIISGDDAMAITGIGDLNSANTISVNNKAYSTDEEIHVSVDNTVNVDQYDVTGITHTNSESGNSDMFSREASDVSSIDSITDIAWISRDMPDSSKIGYSSNNQYNDVTTVYSINADSIKSSSIDDKKMEDVSVDNILVSKKYNNGYVKDNTGTIDSNTITSLFIEGIIEDDSGSRTSNNDFDQVYSTYNYSNNGYSDNEQNSPITSSDDEIDTTKNPYLYSPSSILITDDTYSTDADIDITTNDSAVTLQTDNKKGTNPSFSIAVSSDYRTGTTTMPLNDDSTTSSTDIEKETINVNVELTTNSRKYSYGDNLTTTTLTRISITGNNNVTDNAGNKGSTIALQNKHQSTKEQLNNDADVTVSSSLNSTTDTRSEAYNTYDDKSTNSYSVFSSDSELNSYITSNDDAFTTTKINYLVSASTIPIDDSAHTEIDVSVGDRLASVTKVQNESNKESDFSFTIAESPENSTATITMLLDNSSEANLLPIADSEYLVTVSSNDSTKDHNKPSKHDTKKETINLELNTYSSNEESNITHTIFTTVISSTDNSVVTDNAYNKSPYVAPQNKNQSTMQQFNAEDGITVHSTITGTVDTNSVAYSTYHAKSTNSDSAVSRDGKNSSVTDISEIKSTIIYNYQNDIPNQKPVTVFSDKTNLLNISSTVSYLSHKTTSNESEMIKANILDNSTSHIKNIISEMSGKIRGTTIINSGDEKDMSTSISPKNRSSITINENSKAVINSITKTSSIITSKVSNGPDKGINFMSSIPTIFSTTEHSININNAQKESISVSKMASNKNQTVSTIITAITTSIKQLPTSTQLMTSTFKSPTIQNHDDRNSSEDSKYGNEGSIDNYDDNDSSSTSKNNSNIVADESTIKSNTDRIDSINVSKHSEDTTSNNSQNPENSDISGNISKESGESNDSDSDSSNSDDDSTDKKAIDGNNSDEDSSNESSDSNQSNSSDRDRHCHNHREDNDGSDNSGYSNKNRDYNRHGSHNNNVYHNDNKNTIENDKNSNRNPDREQNNNSNKYNNRQEKSNNLQYEHSNNIVNRKNIKSKDYRRRSKERGLLNPTQTEHNHSRNNRKYSTGNNINNNNRNKNENNNRTEYNNQRQDRKHNSHGHNQITNKQSSRNNNHNRRNIFFNKQEDSKNNEDINNQMRNWIDLYFNKSIYSPMNLAYSNEDKIRSNYKAQPLWKNYNEYKQSRNTNDQERDIYKMDERATNDSMEEVVRPYNNENDGKQESHHSFRSFWEKITFSKEKKLEFRDNLSKFDWYR